MRVIAEHNCSKRHRTAAAFARCAWPNAEEVVGHGFLAVISTCEDPRIFLLGRLRPAHTLKAELGVFGCGAAICTREHELLAIDIDGPEPDPAPAAAAVAA